MCIRDSQALVLEPNQPEALYRLGRNQLRDGDPESAAATLRRALRFAGPETLLLIELAVAGGKPGAHVALGVTAYRGGDAEAALGHFDEVAKAYADRPDDPQAVYL